MTAGTKADTVGATDGSRVISLIALILVPWIALLILLYFAQTGTGSSGWNGAAKFTLLVALALLIVLYERCFIAVARTGIPEPGQKSPYKFDHKNFLRLPDDPAVTAALNAWTTNKSNADVVEVMKHAQPDGNEAFKRLTQIVDKLQSRIGEEYTDIASRTGWLVTGQAFLLAAFVTVLNAERLDSGAKQWLTMGIGLAGAIISFVLALSIFYGAALAEALKVPRDAAEGLAQTQFMVPRTGVTTEQGGHIFSHYATRYIPCLAYFVWVVLTLLAIQEAFGRTAPSGMTLMFPPVATGSSGRGWQALEASPSFAIGAAKFDATVTGCSAPQETQQKVDDWLGRLLKKWRDRPMASKSDVLILVGGADRITLSGDLKHQYDSNVGLARDRAETVKSMLLKDTGTESDEHRLTAERVLVLVTGPQYLPKPIGTGQKEDCKDPRLAEDRRVQVWLPSGG